jgi:PRC-barrel domain protein
MAAFDPATLDRWRALAIVDRDGTTVGTVSEFYLDRETGHPTWALVNTGLFGATRTFVPLVHATEISDGLQVPYEKNHIKDAPRVDPHDELTPDEEATLFGHYGVEYQPSTEPTPPEPGLADPTEPVAQPDPGNPQDATGAGSDLGNPPDAVRGGSDPGNPPDIVGTGSALGHPPDAAGTESGLAEPTPESGRGDPARGDPDLSRPAPIEPGLPGSISTASSTPTSVDPGIAGTPRRADDFGTRPRQADETVDEAGLPSQQVDEAGPPPSQGSGTGSPGAGEAGSPPLDIEADRLPSSSSEQAAGDPGLATTGPGPVPATDEAALTVGAAPQPSTEPFTHDPEDPMTGRLDDERPGTEPPPFDESVWPATSRATTGDEQPASVDADPARTTDAADRPPRPPEEAGWAPDEPGGFEEQEPADRPTGASDLRFHEADADQETTSTPPEDRSPLERARRRLERLVSGGQAPNDPSPADRDAPERARRQRFGLDEPDDHHRS